MKVPAPGGLCDQGAAPPAAGAGGLSAGGRLLGAGGGESSTTGGVAVVAGGVVGNDTTVSFTSAHELEVSVATGSAGGCCPAAMAGGCLSTGGPAPPP